MAILGGSVFPPLQAAIIDTSFTVLGLSSTNLSFVVPLVCFIVVALYGHRAFVRFHIKTAV
jgi:FHS family L-fucose permease-like MFS transporter